MSAEIVQVPCGMPATVYVYEPGEHDEDSAIDFYLDDYLAARGLDFAKLGHPQDGAARREATELFHALDQSGGTDCAAVRHEIADVVLAVAVTARQLGVSVEECIAEKIAYDRGRGPKR